MGARTRTRSGRPVVIPTPAETDFEDVHWALSAATTLWERGEDHEALKWLRRAASAAADRDADVRAVELFKAAADVAGVIEARSAIKTGSTPAPTHQPPSDRPPSDRPSSPQTSSAQAPGAPEKKVPVARPRKSVPLRQQPDGPPQLPPEPKFSAGTPRTPGPTRRPTEPLNLVPQVPPEPTVSERFGEEDTFIRPETMLRRALMAIDPSYADRTDYTQRGLGSIPDDSEEDTARQRGEKSSEAISLDASALIDDEDGERHVASEREAPTAKRSSSLPGLATFRVAVLAIPEERDVRLIFLAPGTDPPEGVAVALLVPPSEHDAELIHEIYKDTDAKL